MHHILNTYSLYFIIVDTNAAITLSFPLERFIMPLFKLEIIGWVSCFNTVSIGKTRGSGNVEGTGTVFTLSGWVTSGNIAGSAAELSLIILKMLGPSFGLFGVDVSFGSPFEISAIEVSSWSSRVSCCLSKMEKKCFSVSIDDIKLIKKSAAAAFNS